MHVSYNMHVIDYNMPVACGIFRIGILYHIPTKKSLRAQEKLDPPSWTRGVSTFSKPSLELVTILDVACLPTLTD